MDGVTDQEARDFYRELRCFAGNHVWQPEPEKWHKGTIKTEMGHWLYHDEGYIIQKEHRCRHCRKLLATDSRSVAPKAGHRNKQIIFDRWK